MNALTYIERGKFALLDRGRWYHALHLMDSNEKIVECTPMLWNSMVGKVPVAADGIMHFTYKNGTVLCV